MALSKTFVAGQPLSAADVNTHLANPVPTAGAAYYATGHFVAGKTGAADRVSAASAIAQRRGETVHLDGFLTIALATTIDPGAEYALAFVSHTPQQNWMGMVSTIKGPLEMVVYTDGRMTLRNWSGAAKALAVGDYVALSNIRYVTVTA